MEFKAARCPNCNGDLQLPENLVTVKCMYCQSDIIIKDAIKLKSNEFNLENVMSLAKTALENGNNKEAYEYYTKILEVDINNYEAWYGKAISVGWLSSLTDMRLNELVDNLKRALEYAPVDKKEELKKKSATEINNLCVALFNLSEKTFNIYVNLESFREYINRVELLVIYLSFANKLDPLSEKIIDNIVFLTQSYMDVFVSNITGEKVFLTESGYQEAKKTLEEAEDKMKIIDSNYKVIIPEYETERSRNPKPQLLQENESYSGAYIFYTILSIISLIVMLIFMFGKR